MALVDAENVEVPKRLPVVLNGEELLFGSSVDADNDVDAETEGDVSLVVGNTMYAPRGFLPLLASGVLLLPVLEDGGAGGIVLVFGTVGGEGAGVSF